MVLKNELKLTLIKCHKNINHSPLIWITVIFTQSLLNKFIVHVKCNTSNFWESLFIDHLIQGYHSACHLYSFLPNSRIKPKWCFNQTQLTQPQATKFIYHNSEQNLAMSLGHSAELNLFFWKSDSFQDYSIFRYNQVMLKAALWFVAGYLRERGNHSNGVL